MQSNSENGLAPPLRQPAIDDGTFQRRIWLVVFAACVVVVVWRLSEVILVAFGAMLLAILLRALASRLRARSKLPDLLAVAMVVLALIAIAGAIAWLLGSRLMVQFHTLADQLPKSLSGLAIEWRATPWGNWLLEFSKDLDYTAATSRLAAGITAWVGISIRAITYLGLLLFAAVYLAAQPGRYRQGILLLAPPNRRERFGAILDLMGVTLNRWLVGQTITMAVVGALTGVGLLVLGIDAPLALGLIAGIFAFVPYVGPVVAAVPGVLMAATLGTAPALYAVALYAGVHFIEGNLITPIVQAEAIELPPVLTLFSALVFGVLLGPVGVLLAAPLLVVLLVAVNTLYLEDVLGEPRAWPPSYE